MGYSSFFLKELSEFRMSSLAEFPGIFQYFFLGAIVFSKKKGRGQVKMSEE